MLWRSSTVCLLLSRELHDPFQIEPDPITIVCQKNEPRSYHDRFPKKWARSDREISRFDLAHFRSFLKNIKRIYPNKAQNLEKKHFIFFEKIYITFRFYKKDLNLSLWYIVIIYLLLSIFQIRSLIISYFFNCEIV